MAALTLVKTVAPASSPLSDAMALELYFDRHLVVRRLTAETIQNYRRLVGRLLREVGKPVWEVTPRDYERWMLSVLKRKTIKIPTQRSYQVAIKGFYAYLIDDPEFHGLVLQTAGHRLENPINAHTAVTHRVEDETEGEATMALTRDEFDQLIAVIDQKIIANAGNRYALRQHQRNKAMVSLQYYAGLRVHELVALSFKDFQPLAATRALLGKFGSVRVRGKRSRCSPKPVAVAPIVSASFRPVAEWYFGQVRPKFPIQQDDDSTRAVFLNRNGKRLTRWAYMLDFRVYLKAAGLWVCGRGTHAARRSTLTHASEKVDLDFAQMIARHRHQATTQLYVRIPKPARMARLRTMVDATVTRVRANGPQKPSSTRR